MVLFAKSMIVFSVLVFLVGLIKPKWVLFWMKAPDRLVATSLGLLLFMASFTGFSELTRVPHKAKDAKPAATRSVDDQNELKLDRGM